MTALPDLPVRRFSLLVVDGQASLLLPTLIARLALGAPIRVLDAGNCFAAYSVAREIRRATPDLHTALKRIQIARAFTCYQVLALLEDTSLDSTPVLALDLLSTFYDESVRLAERQRLLIRCAQELQRISRQVPVGVVVYLRPGKSDTPILLKILEKVADQVWRFEPERSLPPARLF